MTDHRPHDRDETGQAGPTEDDKDERADGPLGDIAEEVRRRRAQGQGRRPPQPEGSEGAVGKPESGEW